METFIYGGDNRDTYPFNMKVTIATPTFGKPRYLKECVESTYHQTLATSHIVCGGNLSLEEGIDGNNVEIIHQKPDPGMVVCWSTAASKASTDYVGFLADDNSFQPEFAQKLIGFLETHPECDVVFCNQNHMDAEGNIDKQKSEEFTKFFGRDELPSGVIDSSLYEHIFEKNALPLEACIIRKSVWDKFGPFATNARGCFDHEFMYRLLLQNVKMGFVPDYLMNFRIHDGSYTARAKQDHLIGGIWTYEFLMQLNDKYQEIFKTKAVFLKGRLLRYKMPFKNRIDLMKNLMAEKNGFNFIVKNSFVRILAKTKLWKN